MAEEMSIYLLQATLFDPENIGNKMINNVRHLNNGPLLRTLLCDQLHGQARLINSRSVIGYPSG